MSNTGTGGFKYPNLFSPIILARTMFRNRIFASPVGFFDSPRFGVAAMDAASHYERKAKGGVACVAVGECNVDGKIGTGSDYGIRLDDPLMHSTIFRIADAVRRQGAVCSAELQHAGNCANRATRGLAYGPVSGIARGPLDGGAEGRRYHEMPEEVILQTIEKFADGARYAKACGFGMVTVHGGHGWLISQFLSPALNTRKDKWGGPDIENRSRLAVEILKAIRKAVGPAFPIEMRISGSECYEGGYAIEEGVKFAVQVADYLDLLHVSAGSHEVDEVFTVTHPSMFLEDGCNVVFAGEIKKHVKCKVATVGALGDPGLMEEIIASGKADVVEIARGLIADPDLPRKARTGREGEINHCLRCLNCFSSLLNSGQFYCAINPETSREAEMNLAIPPAEKKRVLIAGGGVAGMQAALTCKSRGHDVVICEKTATLGGVLHCEDNVPFKRKLAEYLKRQAEKIADAGIEVRLRTEVTPEYAASEDVDVLIAAMGARPQAPSIPGVDLGNVFGAEEIYITPEKAGSSVVILGAGLVGVELAIYLASLKRSVAVVEMLGGINHGGNFLHTLALDVEIAKYGVDMHYNTEALRITSGGVICRGSDCEIAIPADTVVYATGQKPLWEEAASLNLSAPDFFIIGDQVAPKNIAGATSMAFSVARNV